MNKRILKKRVASLFLIFMMLLGVMTENENVLAENKKVDFHIINLSITDSQGNVPPDGFVAFRAYLAGIGLYSAVFFEKPVRRRCRLHTHRHGVCQRVQGERRHEPAE